jgi:hypothetical protein
MAAFVSHPLGRSVREAGLHSKAHEYRRWLDHTITYVNFEKQMSAKICTSENS